MIGADGPMSVSTYMNVCLHDPKQGYYAARPGLGTDFITAPETSQVFGELLGLWAAHEWQAMGKPGAVSLAEMGPGRGTLMADALRTSVGIAGFHPGLSVNLIEASPALQAVQAARLERHAPTFKTGLDEIAHGHTIILANEFLDCLPARQFVLDGDDWRERVIGLNADGELSFGLSAGSAQADTTGFTGPAAELQPGLDLLVDQFAQRREGGDVFRALLVDYGPLAATPGDTLRAYKNGEQVHPLADPGACDLTVDVDFARLKQLAEAAGLAVHGPVPQGQFLLSLGAEARLNALAKAQPDHADAVYQSVKKLVDPAEMGTRFNAVCISTPGLPPPAGF